jgi:hypothetical protein
LGHGADEVDGAESLGGFRDGDSTLGSYRLQRADRCEHHGNSELRSKKCRRRIDIRNIDEHPRSKGEAVQSGSIAAHRGFGLGAAGEIVPDVLRKILARGHDDFLVGYKIDCHIASLVLKR